MGSELRNQTVVCNLEVMSRGGGLIGRRHQTQNAATDCGRNTNGNQGCEPNIQKRDGRSNGIECYSDDPFPSNNHQEGEPYDRRTKTAFTQD